MLKGALSRVPPTDNFDCPGRLCVFGQFFALLKSTELPELCRALFIFSHASHALISLTSMRPRLLTLLCTFVFAASAHAQMRRTIYQVFDVDSVKTVNLEIADIYEIYSWAGSTILIETNVQLSHGSAEILDYLIKEGRYDVAMDTIAMPEVKIYTKMPDRKKKRVKTPDGEITEIPEAKIFVPDTFIWTNDRKVLTRKAN